MQDLQDISDKKKTDQQEDVNMISIQKNSEPTETNPVIQKPFEYTPVSDSESEAESVVDDGEGHTLGRNVNMNREDTGIVCYIRLGSRITKDDLSKKTPRFMKITKDYFNSKLDALKIRVSGTGNQYEIELGEAERLIKEYHFPRYCGRCKQVIRNSRKGCLCTVYKKDIGNVYIRSDPEMRERAYTIRCTRIQRH